MSLVAPEVTVRAIAAGGDGVATLPDGRTVFIPRTAPGDQVRLHQLRLRKRFARAEVDVILAPGPERVDPPCPHYLADRCGSCQLMHLTLAGQRAVKARIIGDALRRIGRLDLPDPEVVVAPAALGYRTKVTFTLGGGRFGYHPLGEPDQLFDVQDCLLAEPVLQALFRGVSAARHTLPREARVVLRRDQEGRLHVIVRTTQAASAWNGASALDTALRGSGFEAVLWWHPDGGRARVMTATSDPWPATVFEQVNPAVGDQVRAAAVEALGEVAGLPVWDLYAGIGETTRLLAERGARVESVELDGVAVAIADRLGPAGPRRHAATVEEAVGRLAPAAAVVTNPPRTGMPPTVVAALRSGGARRIAYISCDPATLARDLAGLAPEYRVALVRAFDQFPQTAHVETLVLLELP